MDKEKLDVYIKSVKKLIKLGGCKISHEDEIDCEDCPFDKQGYLEKFNLTECGLDKNENEVDNEEFLEICEKFLQKYRNNCGVYVKSSSIRKY